VAADIREWLQGLGLDKYADAFAENDVDIVVLPKLTEQDLKDLGLSLGHRRKLMAAIEAIVETSETVSSVAVTTDKDRGSSPSRPDAERRQLTVMFCDLVGSTALSQQLDPEDLRDVMRRYQDAVAGAVTRYGGHVAKYLGDGVLAYFGWPQAHEDQAERAVRAALDCIAAVSSLEATPSTPLAARVGIASGEVVIGDITGASSRDEEAVTGETPNLAARLQGLAEPNTVVVGATTRRLIGDAFRLDDLGKHEIRGFDDVVQVWRVTGESAAASRFEAAHGAALTRFVGREHELGLLQERWRLAQGGEGQVVLLSGEAGIGKSRLVQSIRQQIGDEPSFRLHFQCSPHHTSSALYPIIQHLARTSGFALDDAPDTKLDKLEHVLRLAGEEIDAVAPLFAALMTLPGESRYGTIELEPQELRDRTIEAMVRQVQSLSRQRPVFFVLEDAHWIDPTTEMFIGETIPQIRDTALLMLITHRPNYSPPWGGHPHATTVALSRLGRVQSSEIVQAIGGNELPEAVVEQISDRGDGMPLYLEELTKSVLEADLSADGATNHDAVPTTLQASLTARLDHLGEARDLAQIGAVIGREFSYDLIATISERSAAVIDTELDRLVGSELVFQRGQPPNAVYAFKHALIQDAAYDSLLFTRRRELHARVVSAIEQAHRERLEDQSELLAYHAQHADLWDKALRYCLIAGQRANERSAYYEALQLLEGGLEAATRVSSTDETTRLAIEVRMNLRPCLGAFGNYERLLKAFSEARELAESIGDEYTATVARIDTTHLLYQSGQIETALKEGRQAVRMAGELEDRRLIVGATANLAMGYFMHGSFRKAVETTAKYAGDLRETYRHDRLGTTATSSVNWLSNLAGMHAALGEFDTAIAFSTEARAIADETGKPFDQAMANQWYSFVLTNAGRYQEAIQPGKQALDVANSSGFEFLQTWAGCMYGNACSRVGQDEEALRVLKSAYDLSDRLGLVVCHIWCVAGLALANIEAGSPCEGYRYAENARDLARAHHCDWIELLALQYLGVTNSMLEANQSDNSERIWLDAIALAQRIEARPDLAHSRRQLGTYYASTGREGNAAIELNAAHDLYAELGMLFWLQQTEALLEELT